MSKMRRAAAASLLGAICFWLIAPLLFADPGANLPACCRRNGAHHCAMPMGAMPMGAMPTDSMDAADGPAVLPVPAKCPAYPCGSAASGPIQIAILGGSAETIFAATAGDPAVPQRTGVRKHLSFSRSRYKRGPPAVLA